jgi:hypothetical protein
MGEARRRKEFMMGEEIENSCKSCRYWYRNGNEIDGACRRLPPFPLVIPVPAPVIPIDGRTQMGLGLNYFFPKTRPEIWCGEYKPSES